VTFFTADEHFAHKNILRHIEARSILFKNIDDHDNQLINNYNSVVTNEDCVYFLGDFLPFRKEMDHIERYISKLNGKEKHLVLGNHDIAKPFTYVDAGFTGVHTSFVIKHNNVTIVLNHDPSIQCTLKNEILFCGHIHTLFRVIKEKKIVNVGVDVNNFIPISLDDCLRMLDVI